MAEIFRGRALAAGGFEKPVAIKRILPHLCQDQRFVELLIAEAKVLSLLRHRNIVQIFDVGLGDDGQYFLVMEFVHGLDLGRVQKGLESKRRILPVDLALHVGAEICEALHHAHIAKDPDGKAMRLVHRDIAPSNVLLSLAGEVKLTDFGIAKRAEEVTTHGGVRGKFAYISPEQAKNEPVDPRSDVFSLGIVLFELLTGRRLFSGLSDLDALRGVREGKIPRPRELDGNLPKPIDELLGKALARDPDKRFSSAGEFGTALRSLRYSLEVSSGDPSAELARVVSTAESPDAAPPAPRVEHFEAGEATVIRIRSADVFSTNDTRSAIFQARQVIDRFEEEETRMSKLGPDELRDLRRAREEVSGELDVPRLSQSLASVGDQTTAGTARAVRKSERRIVVEPAREPRSEPRPHSITGDVPTAMADRLDHQRMMEMAMLPPTIPPSMAILPPNSPPTIPPGGGSPSGRSGLGSPLDDKSFELEEETIARPAPIRGPGPTTLKRVPPPSGPGAPPPSGQLPGVRPVPRSSSPPLTSSPRAAASARAMSPVSAMPDAAGWEAPSAFAASPYATPPPVMSGPPTPSPSSTASSPAASLADRTVGAGPMGGGANPMLAMPPGSLGAPGMMQPQHLTPVPNPAMMGQPYPMAGGMAGGPGYPGAYPGMPGFERTSPHGAGPGGGPGGNAGPGGAPMSTALERWRTAALILGAVAMAVLAFAVTRSCLHQEKRRPAAPTTMTAPAGSNSAPAPTPAP